MLYRRGDIWHVRITRNGQTVRRSTGTKDKEQAQEFHDRIATEFWRVKNLGDKPRRTWKEAVIRWNKDTRKRTAQDDLDKIAVLDRWLGSKWLDEITWDSWSDVLSELRHERGLTDSTLNRYTTLVTSILNKAEAPWRWLERAPKLPKFAEPEPLKRFLTVEEAQQSVARLEEWAKDMVLFDLATGIRQGNLCSLRWSWIDMQSHVIRIPGSDFKQGRTVAIPLSADAMKILRRQIGRHQEFVFTRDEKPITRWVIYHAWKRAARGLERVNFHTLRKTWASWLRQSGVSLGNIKEAGGWASMAVVESTYAHIQAEHLLPDVNRLGDRLAQIQHTSPDSKDTKVA